MGRHDKIGLDERHVRETIEAVRSHLDRNLFVIPVYGANKRKQSGKNPNLPSGYNRLYSLEDFSAECEGGTYHLHSSDLGEFGTVTFPSGKYTRLILNTENPYIGTMKDEKWFNSNADPYGYA